jgi:tripartite-type tricarboxylate transporter receptor subunit TctC
MWKATRSGREEPLMVRLIALAALALGAGLQLIGGAAAQQMFPTRTVHFILPFGAGSASDTTARLFAERLSARWGKPVVVENRPGGDGLVSLDAFVGAHDDHTMWVRTGRYLQCASLPARYAAL